MDTDETETAEMKMELQQKEVGETAEVETELSWRDWETFGTRTQSFVCTSFLRFHPAPRFRSSVCTPVPISL
ncbi:hypothetical protein PIB30_056401 [Stylosanthes scabra]|uniref:Uncharacterized protein n=1 Tax=Stylosanthes scabra TaxID=79078 RepID=A0ABU6XHA7_9FABA|nr:hypothetical protein [Stylosanthes scabra]